MRKVILLFMAMVFVLGACNSTPSVPTFDTSSKASFEQSFEAVLKSLDNDQEKMELVQVLKFHDSFARKKGYQVQLNKYLDGKTGKDILHDFKYKFNRMEQVILGNE